MSLKPTRSEELERRYRRALRFGLLFALVAHVLAFVVLSGEPIPLSPFSAAGPRAGGARAAPGGGMQALHLSPPERLVIPQPPPPLVPAALTVEVQREQPDLSAPQLNLSLKDLEGQLGHEQGRATGPGLQGGVGRGAGGTAEEGRFHVVPPRVRGLIMPPDPPDAVRGRKVTVWVFVTADGTVAADSTRLQPPTGDRGYDRKLRHQAARWLFEPALKNGKPVGDWFPYTITM